MDYEFLINEAKLSMSNAYVPYSLFKVGAAVLTKSGSIFRGCNIENVSFGATVCAERVAILKAVSEGHRKLQAIAIYSSNGDFTYPCGICRQVMAEFMKDGILIVGNSKNEIKTYNINDILPFAFTSFK